MVRYARLGMSKNFCYCTYRAVMIWEAYSGRSFLFIGRLLLQKSMMCGFVLPGGTDLPLKVCNTKTSVLGLKIFLKKGRIHQIWVHYRAHHTHSDASREIVTYLGTQLASRYRRKSFKEFSSISHPPKYPVWFEHRHKILSGRNKLGF